MTPPSPRPFRGHLDRITATPDGLLVEGWAAFDPPEPRAAVRASCGDVSALALADQHRPDLTAAGVGDGRHGFSILLPGVAPESAGGLVVFAGDQPLPVRAGATLDPALLSAWPPLVREEGPIAVGISHRHGLLRVWTAGPTSPEVSVIVDGAPVWTGRARRNEVALVGGEPREGRGARVQLPLPRAGAEHRTLSVLVDGAEAPGSPLTVSHPDRFRGYVERIRRTGLHEAVVSGWCVDQGAPSTPVRLLVRDGDTVLGEGDAEGSRADLAEAGVDAPDALFSIVVHLGTDTPPALAVHPAGWSRSLPGETSVPPPSPSGELRVAFAVTEATPTTGAGDYLTALELGLALTRAYGAEVRFLESAGDGWYDVGDADVLIAMRDDYDPLRIRNARPGLVRVAWVRNWFDRFRTQPYAAAWDAVWPSSDPAAEALSAQLGRPAEVVPIATNAERFTAGAPRAEYACDYAFTGSYWGVNREIAQHLDPAGLPFRFGLFGQGWERVAHLAPYARGHVAYAELPHVYASTRLVIDDANHVTKRWGAVNSRVFDALAAGALVVSNVQGGSEALFDGLLPTYGSPQELEELLWTYLGDEGARLERVEVLRSIVLARHTYAHRARQIWPLIQPREAQRGPEVSPASS